MADQISSSQYKEIYEDMKIDMDKLFCVMLDVEMLQPDEEEKEFPGIPEKYLVHDESGDKPHIDGYVAEKGEAHCTLLYGILDMVSKYHVEEVLEGWGADIVIEEISHFESPEHYCVIAKVKKTARLVKGHQLCELLPHINTFLDYTPHVTLAYIKRDDEILEEVKEKFKFLEGKRFDIKKITYDNNSGTKRIIKT